MSTALHLFTEPDEEDFQQLDAFEASEAFVKRLHAESKLQTLEKISEKDELPAKFLQNQLGNYFLRRIASGADSSVYIFLEKETGRFGLLKLYDGKNCPIDLIMRYRGIVQGVIGNIDQINEQISSTKIDINGENYSVILKAIPVGEPVEKNGVVGIFVEGENWVRGSNLQNMQTDVGPASDVDSLVARDVSSEQANTMFRLPYVLGEQRERLLDTIISPPIQAETGLSDLLLHADNVKIEIDRTKKILYLVITDICADIRETFSM